ncbi:uncharacterized protein NPIL_127361 [Nephila pilipes]|uniref:XK-related protein n=1 Tax=Nephila pilipes TaxID=299642 RepID=A0A8X6P788_NEPPI|nr:uncharacterized protein NPIL_127361 [Nephila pilipes]
MVLDVKIKLPAIERIKVSRVVLISGILTFLYLIEFCVAIRGVYHSFRLWNASLYDSQRSQAVSWTLCVACLLVCVTSSFTANLISAIWEQRQLKDKGEQGSAIRFAFHIIVGGMIWRYICLWFSDKKELLKKEAILLTMTKFLFTQFYTIPMVITSASLLENFHEIIYNLCTILCISLTLVLTCIMFSWCKNEVDELKKWNFETVDLVPLIFCESSDDDLKGNAVPKSDARKVSENPQKESSEPKDDVLETTFIRTLVLLQTFSFTFGRLLALGILLKLAGIYAVSIMFLQLLISVVYLKFQVPFLVSDSLPKWRQLARLAFMSYILIFEWHLNRDPKTGYDFTSNIKHSMLYYFIATLESIFYFVTWAITENYASSDYLNYVNSPKQKFVRNMIIVGSLSLIFSLTIYILLMFWQSRRLSKLFHSIQRRYLSSKLRMSEKGNRNWMKRKSERNSNRPQVDISNPIPIESSVDDQNVTDLTKHSSYRDLREPLDEDIEIYVRNKKENNEFKTVSDTIENDLQQSSYQEEESSCINKCENSNVEENTVHETFDTVKNEHEETIEETKFSDISYAVDPPAVINVNYIRGNDNNNDGNTVLSNNNNNNEMNPNIESITNESIGNKFTKTAETPVSTNKSKVTVFSESVSESWNKFSSLSRKFTGAMQEHFQKRKEQFQNFRPSSEQDKKPDKKSNEKSHPSDTVSVEEVTSVNINSFEKEKSEISSVDPDFTESYFVGDSRCQDEDSHDSTLEARSLSSNTEIEIVGNETCNNSPETNMHEEVNDSEPVHCEGDEPCPCFVCKTLGDGNILRRRRSSSVPLPERKALYNLPSKVLLKQTSLSDCATDLKAVHMDTKANAANSETHGYKISKSSFIPKLYTKGSFHNLSVMSLDNRIEHYV